MSNSRDCVVRRRRDFDVPGGVVYNVKRWGRDVPSMGYLSQDRRVRMDYEVVRLTATVVGVEVSLS